MATASLCFLPATLTASEGPHDGPWLSVLLQVVPSVLCRYLGMVQHDLQSIKEAKRYPLHTAIAMPTFPG